MQRTHKLHISPENPDPLSSSAAASIESRRVHGSPQEPILLRRYLKIAVVTALSLLALIALFPYLQIGFTTKDDTEIALMAGQRGGLLHQALNFAAAQGRFYSVLTMMGLFLPHYFRHPAWYYTFQLGSILLNVALFYLLLRKMFCSSAFALLAAALGLTFLENNWYHSFLTSYPFVPHFGLSSLFCSFLFFIDWQRREELSFAVLSGIAYFVSLLVYESFAPYCLVFFGFCIYKGLSNRKMILKDRIAGVTKAFSPILLALIFYFGTYCIFRVYHPSHYEGNQIAPFNAGRIGAVVWQYATSTLPGYFYLRDPGAVQATFDGFGYHAIGFTELVDRCRIEWVVKALIVSILCASILLGRPRIFTAKSFSLAVIAGVACIAAPVLPLGFTTKYQSWVLESHSLAHSPSYYSYFAMVFLLTSILIFLNQKIGRSRILLLSYVVFASSVVAAGSFATDFYNYYITNDQRLAYLKWTVLDHFIQTEDFKALPANAVIYAPSLWRTRGILAHDPGYWTAYFTQKSGKVVQVVREPREISQLVRKTFGSQLYFLDYKQESKEPDQYIVFAKLEGVSPVARFLYATDFALFTYSKNKKFTLIGQCSPGETPTKIVVNNQLVGENQDRLFACPIDRSGVLDDFPKTTVRSTSPIDLSSLVVSYFDMEPSEKGVQVRYEKGFQGLEEDGASGSTWDWSLGDSEVSFFSYFDSPVTREIRFGVSTFTPRTVFVQIGETERTIRFDHPSTESVQLSKVTLLPGPNKLRFTTDQPPSPPGNGDPRLIAFGIHNLVVLDAENK